MSTSPVEAGYSRCIATTTVEGREQIVEELAGTTDQLALAVACLGEAFELLDTGSAERLESDLFRPVQKAYAGNKRTLTQFADRYGLNVRPLETPSAGLKSQGVKSFVERAAEAADFADQGLAELQDSMMPIEFGDAELRAALAEIRELLGSLPVPARQFLRTLGR